MTWHGKAESAEWEDKDFQSYLKLSVKICRRNYNVESWRCNIYMASTMINGLIFILHEAGLERVNFSMLNEAYFHIFAHNKKRIFS